MPPYDTTTPNWIKTAILAEAQNWRCCYCGIACDWQGEARPTRDHLVPKVSKKFAQYDGWENEVMACALCNSNRGSMNSWTYYHKVKKKGRDGAAKWAATRQRRRMRAHIRMVIAQKSKSPLLAEQQR